jgi:cytochrome c oxidase cbb3-type subunit 3
MALRLMFAGILLLSIALAAQEMPPSQGGRGGRGRGGAQGTREFLGLGPAPDAAAAERGAKVYAPNCAFCHGEKARGAEGADLVRSTLVLHDEKGELIGPLLLQGRPDKGMPAFPSLTEAERNDIAQFLHLQVELAANRGTYRRLNIVTGDAKKGEAYFNGAGQCGTCHSATGDLAHIASRFSQPDQLQNRFLFPGGGGFGAGPERQKKATVTLPSGQTVSGTLKRLDDFNVSIYDSSGNYRSWPRESVTVNIDDNMAKHRELLEHYTDEDIHNLTAYLVTLK